MQPNIPKLVTFDGEARSGKGTVVGKVKDYLRDECGHKVMLIDAGQVFRVLAVGVTSEGLDINSPSVLDDYLGDESNISSNMRLVKSVYHMPKQEREALLYTDQVGIDSAKIGARPLSQELKDMLLRKWLKDAHEDGYDTVLLDGRALEETGEMLASQKLCEYVMGLFFVCDPVVSAQRTLGHMPLPYSQLDDDFRSQVDEVVAQIEARNKSDRERPVQPVVEPDNAPTYSITEVPEVLPDRYTRPMVIIDRSIEVSMDTMALPIAKLIAKYVE